MTEQRLDDLPPLDDEPPPGFEEWARESGGRQNKGRGPRPKLHWHRDADPNVERAWLVRNIVPEIGKGLASGQWGTGKTFTALDLCASVMTGEPFAGRRVLKRGGCLFIAPEGASEIPTRLRGLVEARIAGPALAMVASGEGSIDTEDLPFAWIEECPRLVDAEAIQELTAVAMHCAAQLHDLYNLPLVLIVIDTVAAGAGFDDENSAAETQKAMNALETLSQRTGAFVLGVDHFGKATETGTRGSSAKEAAADVVLAMLGDRDAAGNVSNLRMAVRKVRGAPTGMETPYTLDVVEIGTDRWGDPITTCVVGWKVDQTGEPATATVKERWPTSLRVFRSSMTTALIEHGKPCRPYGNEGPEVRGVAESAVRAEFGKNYPTDGETEKHRAEAKKKAFGRALKTAMGKGLVVSRDMGGVDHLWFVGTEDERDTQGDRTGHS